MRSRSLADYTIDTHESEFSEATSLTAAADFASKVDRQTKQSYTTYEAAEAAGLAIKKAYPPGAMRSCAPITA